jgi:hypothetical protein
MHGVNEDFGATISAVFDEANPTIPSPMASQMPLLAFPTCVFLEFSEGKLRVHNSIETIAVIGF